MQEYVKHDSDKRVERSSPRTILFIDNKAGNVTVSVSKGYVIRAIVEDTRVANFNSDVAAMVTEAIYQVSICFEEYIADGERAGDEFDAVFVEDESKILPDIRKKIEVIWRIDNTYHRESVTSLHRNGLCEASCDDGEEEKLDLTNTSWRFATISVELATDPSFF